MTRKTIALILIPVVFLSEYLISCRAGNFATKTDEKPPQVLHLTGLDADKIDWKVKDNAYWKKSLSSAQYRVCRQGGTELAFSGFYNAYKEGGVYHCSNCANPLFSSDSKFDSGTGWPSFDRPYSDQSVKLKEDYSIGGVRTEVVCARCGAHLGHVFDDGPTETGKRYCMNSVCLLHRPEVSAAEALEK